MMSTQAVSLHHVVIYFNVLRRVRSSDLTSSSLAFHLPCHRKYGGLDVCTQSYKDPEMEI